ncbi:MAG: hypothetical protein M1812_001430 [Candelaria pacifica]|nr:MAG: hypothetical protein M1812_001430 [Candelaria pacifica]
MQFSKTTIIAAALYFLSSVDAHMIMRTPTPFGKANLDNSPLDLTGKDFPCKQRPGVYDAQGASNPMPLGSSQVLSFTGSAVHGGGSCQISITYDKNPTKDSKFKVIHSIVGGCPATADGNLPENAAGQGASNFTYTIPKDLPTGDAVLAWTWFNNIGNREMYMNCAPISITGATSKRARFTPYKRDQASFNALPDMFVANIPTTVCQTETGNLLFPDPGKSVETHVGESDKPKPPHGPQGTGAPCPGAGVSAPANGSSGSSGNAASSGSSPGAASPVPAGGSSGSSGSSSGSDMGMGGGSSAAAPAATSAAGGSSGSAPAATSAAPLVAQSSAAAAPPAASGSASSGSPAGGSTGASTGGTVGTCSTADFGKSLCSPDNKMIGMCDQGGKIVWGPVASGLVCKEGYQVAARSTRVVHRRRQHGGSHI